MNLDMKARKPASSRRTSGGGMLIGLFVGLVIGVLVAAGVVWYIHRTPMPFNNKVQPPPPPPAQAAAGQQPTPMPLPGKPGDPIPQQGDKPRFDFYKILPGNAEATPEAKEAEPKAADNKSKGEKDAPQKDGALKEPVYLQTGSFQNAADADSHKARLALLGAEASIQQVMLQEKVWYRVRLGPFKKMDDVNNIRADLAKQGIEAKIVKKD